MIAIKESRSFMSLTVVQSIYIWKCQPEGNDVIWGCQLLLMLTNLKGLVMIPKYIERESEPNQVQCRFISKMEMAEHAQESEDAEVVAFLPMYRS